MKKIGEYIAIGTITEGTYNGSENRIQLFDGRFDTAYKIVSFVIAPASPASSQELIGKLSTEPKSNVTTWFWNDVEEVGWAHWGADKYQDSFSNVREDSLIVEDLWISGYNETLDASSLNYEIVLEKYDLGSDWRGTLSMIKNKSQA